MPTYICAHPSLPDLLLLSKHPSPCAPGLTLSLRSPLRNLEKLANGNPLSCNSNLFAGAFISYILIKIKDLQGPTYPQVSSLTLSSTSEANFSRELTSTLHLHVSFPFNALLARFLSLPFSQVTFPHIIKSLLVTNPVDMTQIPSELDFLAGLTQVTTVCLRHTLPYFPRNTEFSPTSSASIFSSIFRDPPALLDHEMRVLLRPSPGSLLFALCPLLEASSCTP